MSRSGPIASRASCRRKILRVYIEALFPDESRRRTTPSKNNLTRRHTMHVPFDRKSAALALAVAGIAAALATGEAHASAFALQETSGSALGNAFAAGAAAADDASSIWSNPASMSRFATPQLALAAHAITPSMKFGNDASVPATL